MCLDRRVALVALGTPNLSRRAVVSNRIDVSEIAEAPSALCRPAGPGSRETICALSRGWETVRNQ